MSVARALEEVVAAAVDAALAEGAADAEAYAEDSGGTEVRVYEGEVESLSDSAERGIGVRAWIDGRAGYAYGTDLAAAGIEAVAAAAADAASVSDRDEHAGAPAAAGAAPPIEGISDPRLGEWTTERKVELAVAAERAARAADRSVSAVEQTVYADSTDRVAIASSAGIAAAYEATSCYAYLQAMAGAGDALQTGLGFGLARTPEGLDPEAIGREGGERAASLVGAARPGSRVCPVLLDATVAASFIGLIGSTLAADAVQRGRSPFAGRLGAGIASDALALADDGTDPEGLAAAPVDAEGVPRRRTPLIEAGRLDTYLHDSYTARRDGSASTGNASRAAYRSPPSVSTSNLVVGEGTLDFEGLAHEAGEGVYVSDVVGLHSGVNPVSGTFSVGASGRLISGGELAEPVSGFTIASDLSSMLLAVRAAGSRGRWVPFGGSVRTPPLLIGEMTVSGE